jgi:CPA2 family monovalent cation:H+ antiporter-2
MWRRLRGRVAVLLVDVALLAAIVIGATIAAPRAGTIGARVDLGDTASRAILWSAAGVLGILFLIGVVRALRGLATAIAAEIIPTGSDGQVDLGTAPRRVLVLALELALVLVVGLPSAALIQPFVAFGMILPALGVLVIALAGWSATSNLHGHVSAGSELILEAMSAQRRAPTQAELTQVEAMLPGFAGLAPVTLAAASPAVGRSLAELNLRALTGASVLAITRGDGGTAHPEPTDPLRAGDTLALAGSAEAVAAARAILLGEPVHA